MRDSNGNKYSKVPAIRQVSYRKEYQCNNYKNCTVSKCKHHFPHSLKSDCFEGCDHEGCDAICKPRDPRYVRPVHDTIKGLHEVDFSGIGNGSRIIQKGSI